MITRETRAQIFELDLKGLSQKDIAKALGLSTSCVNDNLIKYKGRKRLRKISSTIGRLIEAYDFAKEIKDYNTMVEIALSINQFENGEKNGS